MPSSSLASLSSRPATAADREAVYELNRAAYRDVVTRQFGSWDEEWQRQHFERKWERAGYRIIELDGRLVGAIWSSEHPDHWRLDEIQILPAFQGRGIGTTLIRQELERARRAGKPLRLQVLRLNRARELYERLGFTHCGETETHTLMEADRA